MPLQVSWQWVAAVLALLFFLWSRLVLFFGSLGNLLVLSKIEVKLVKTFRFRPEPVPVGPMKLVLKLLNF